MKHFFLLVLSSILFFSCTNEPAPDFVSLSGKIKNNKDSLLSIFNRQGLIKSIRINEDGSFTDTLKISDAGIYTFATSLQNRGPIFLKNGYNIRLSCNAKNFLETIEFSGEGAENSSFILAQIEQGNKIGDPQNIFELNSSDFKKKVEALSYSYDSIFNQYDNLDSLLIANVKNQNSQVLRFLEAEYNKYQIMGKGKPSPKFVDYLDIKGGTKSLSDFKGKYVYIDVWATWCAPCIAQFPFLKELKAEYKDKNIVFVGISTDESRRNGGSWEAAEEKWRTFVKEKELGDVQLWSGKDFSFQQAYQITGIPRFILIDPEGNIIDAQAPRPSDPSLSELFDSLGI